MKATTGWWRLVAIPSGSAPRRCEPLLVLLLWLPLTLSSLSALSLFLLLSALLSLFLLLSGLLSFDGKSRCT